MATFPVQGPCYLGALDGDLAWAIAMLRRHQSLLRQAMTPAAPECPFYPAALLRLIEAAEAGLEAAQKQTATEAFALEG